MPSADNRIEAPQMGRRGVKAKRICAVAMESGFGERSAHDGSSVHIVGDEKVGKIRGNTEAAPSQTEEGLVDAVKRALNVPRGEEDGGASLRRFF